MLKNNVNGVKTDTALGTYPNTNYWIRMVKTGANISFFEKPSQAAAWNQVGSVTRADLNTGLPLQVGIEQSDYAGGTTQQAQFANFSLTASSMAPLATVPSAPNGLSLTTDVHGDINASWTPGAGSTGSLVMVWTNLTGAMKEAPANGFVYTGNGAYGAGGALPGAGYYVVYSGSGTNVTIVNLAAGTTYGVAVFSCTQSGGAATTAYNHNPVIGNIVTGGYAPGSVVAQASVQTATY